MSWRITDCQARWRRCPCPAPNTGWLWWPKRSDLLGLLADQHVDDMAGAEALAGAIDRGQRLDRGVGAVPGLDRREAGVAVAAVAGMGLAEMGEDRLAAAAGGLADAEQRVELAALDALDLVGRVALVDHAAALDDVGHAVGHPGVGRQAVAAGAAGLLVIGLDRGRAGRDGRRSARRACRCPCRRRRWRRGRARPP